MKARELVAAEICSELFKTTGKTALVATKGFASQEGEMGVFILRFMVPALRPTFWKKKEI